MHGYAGEISWWNFFATYPQGGYCAIEAFILY